MLGIWQLNRLEWKQGLINTFEETSSKPPVDLQFAEKTEFVKIKLNAKINRQYKIFFPAKTFNGKNGFRLASILQTSENENILIDEGWYPKENHAYFLTNDKIVSKQLIGYIRYPRKAKLFTPKNNTTANEW